jgi:hypothetical protein
MKGLPKPTDKDGTSSNQAELSRPMKNSHTTHEAFPELACVLQLECHFYKEVFYFKTALRQHLAQKPRHQVTFKHFRYNTLAYNATERWTAHKCCVCAIGWNNRQTLDEHIDKDGTPPRPEARCHEFRDGEKMICGGSAPIRRASHTRRTCKGNGHSTQYGHEWPFLTASAFLAQDITSVAE